MLSRITSHIPRAAHRIARQSPIATARMATAALSPNVVDLTHPAASPSPPPPSITPAQIAIVKATAPVLKEYGVTITTLFYKNMLTAHPELKNIFSSTSQATGAQPRALANAVLAYATHIDNLPALQHAVERIAHKHASLNVQAAQYPIVGQHLLAAIGAVLGDAATPEIVDAWTAAYGVLASVFVEREAVLYRAHEKWVGWRKFKIVRREAESACIESFYLAPVDGKPLPGYLPGQYVSLQVFVPQLGYLQSRQYSLSEAPRSEGNYYRISVKKELGEAPGVPGLISNMLHEGFKAGDEVELTHPQGEFFVDPADETKEDVPVVLISAGVGATPLMSILDSITRQPSSAVGRPISWLHASRSRAMQPFAHAVRQIQNEHENRMRSHVFLDEITPNEQEGVDYDFAANSMDLSKVDKEKDLFVGNARAEYYICGPEAFMVHVRGSLEEMGVDRARVHLELFATGDIE